MNHQTITVQQIVNAPIEKVWGYWTKPEHITQWNNASADWHTPRAENDLRVGGKFSARMEARDGSMGFDFAGVYTKVIPQKQIEYVMKEHIEDLADSGRNVEVVFLPEGVNTRVIEKFEPEPIHPVEMQQSGWQSILDNFKTYVESH